MPGNRNISPQEKIKAVKEFLSGNGSEYTIAEKYGVSRSGFRRWVLSYKAFGDCAFIKTRHKAHYTSKFKKTVVNAYLNGDGTLEELTIKYKISSESSIREWIIKYNSHEKLKSSGTGGNTIMTKGRKTTFDERTEIVRYCIEQELDYAKTARKYQVSYQQVYQWVNKYQTNGVEGLVDKRGCKKQESEMSELEKLRAENRLLQAEKRKVELENVLLKKLEEIERRRY